MNYFSDVASTAYATYSIVPGTTISTDTTTSGTAIDMQTTEGPVTGVFLTGNAGDASTTITFKLMECDTSGGVYTNIADGVGSTLAASASANDNLVTLITATKRTKRYVKCVVVTAGGGTPSVPVAAFAFARKKISGTGTGYVSV